MYTYPCWSVWESLGDIDLKKRFAGFHMHEYAVSVSNASFHYLGSLLAEHVGSFSTSLPLLNMFWLLSIWRNWVESTSSLLCYVSLLVLCFTSVSYTSHLDFLFSQLFCILCQTLNFPVSFVVVAELQRFFMVFKSIAMLFWIFEITSSPNLSPMCYFRLWCPFLNRNL